jgi:hypothetical protein
MITFMIVFVLFRKFPNSFAKWGWFEKWSVEMVKMITFMIISDFVVFMHEYSKRAFTMMNIYIPMYAFHRNH